jgi:SAM-dependent methyltransferase
VDQPDVMVERDYWSDLRRHTEWEEIWMNHPAVRARINRRVTGDDGLWPIAWLRGVVPDRVPFRRALSVGCGVGNFERSLVELDLVERVTGIDASGAAIEKARRSAQEAGMEGRIRYAVGDARRILPAQRDLDAVFFHASLHHFDRLPELLGLVRATLSGRGVLYLDEYVGPARGEWGLGHLVSWNLLYRRLPGVVRRTRIVRRPINRDDPTEAVASSGILPAVAQHFRTLARRDYGGNLLAVLYPSLRRPGAPGGPTGPIFDAIVEDLLEREERLLRRGENSFYSVVVAEPRPEVA